MYICTMHYSGYKRGKYIYVYLPKCEVPSFSRAWWWCRWFSRSAIATTRSHICTSASIYAYLYSETVVRRKRIYRYITNYACSKTAKYTQEAPRDPNEYHFCGLLVRPVKQNLKWNVDSFRFAFHFLVFID